VRTQTFFSSMAGIAAAAVVAGSANATFVEFYQFKTQPVADGSGIDLDTYMLYARFNGATDTVLNTSNFHRTDSNVTSMFYHKDTSQPGGIASLSTSNGSWNPAIGTTANRGFDSFLTIGAVSNSSNTTIADSSWGSTSWNRPDVPNGLNVGWSTATSTSTVGRVPGSGDRIVRLGQFAIARHSYAGVWNMKIGYNSGVSGAAMEYAESTFSLGVAPVPVPGAAALLGLAGMVASRRRRN